MIIAVDGPTASGKGTIAKALAAHFGLPHLDTGLLYRAVGRQVLLGGGNPDDPADALAAADFPESLLGDDALRSEEAGALASRVSVHPAVRAALLARTVRASTVNLRLLPDSRAAVSAFIQFYAHTPAPAAAMPTPPSATEPAPEITSALMV